MGGLYRRRVIEENTKARPAKGKSLLTFHGLLNVLNIDLNIVLSIV
jgi:hypothetical protein